MWALSAPGTKQFVPIAKISAQDAIGIPGTKGTLQQSIRVQALNPLAVLHVGFPPRHIFGLPGIDQQDMKSAGLQDLEDRNPIDPRGFHGDAFDAAFLKPIGQGFQLTSKGSKLAHRFLSPAWRNADPMFPGTNIDAGGVRIDFFPSLMDGGFPLFFF